MPRAAALPPRFAEGLGPSVRTVKASLFQGSGAGGRKGGAFPQIVAAEPRPPGRFFHTFSRPRLNSCGPPGLKTTKPSYADLPH